MTGTAFTNTSGVLLEICKSLEGLAPGRAGLSLGDAKCQPGIHRLAFLTLPAMPEPEWLLHIKS